MQPYYQQDNITLYLGDCREVLPSLEVACHAVVTDPPYDLLATSRNGSGRSNPGPGPFGRYSGRGGFMGLAWDATGVAFRADTWEAVSRVLLPGAHLLAFGGTRTHHRMVCAVEDAGFEIRDEIAWLYPLDVLPKPSATCPVLIPLDLESVGGTQP